jgi:hypothetical protein
MICAKSWQTPRPPRIASPALVKRRFLEAIDEDAAHVP